MLEIHSVIDRDTVKGQDNIVRQNKTSEVAASVTEWSTGASFWVALTYVALHNAAIIRKKIKKI